jgi:Reverse transcriptase (RNA-dependent DNA polymerase)
MTDLPKEHKSIGVKWVYKKKITPQGTIERHKVKLVVKGYRQKTGINYDELFALVARMEIIRLLISQTTQNEWPVHQMDVKLTFVNGVLEEVYVEQPLGYMKLRKEHNVLRLKKTLYGLKQALRAWNTRIDSYFKENDFKLCPFEVVIYVKAHNNELLIVGAVTLMIARAPRDIHSIWEAQPSHGCRRSSTSSHYPPVRPSIS